MALPEQYSLMHSEYNVFLAALIGEGSNGMPISVISAFARFGLDPWKEAERLSALPRDRAVSELSTFIGGIEGGAWPTADTSAIAGRLMSLLPGPRSTIMRVRAGGDRIKRLATLSKPPDRMSGAAGARPASRVRVPISGNQSHKPESVGGNEGGGRSRWMFVAILALLVAVGAAWFDAKFNHDKSMVPEERGSSDQL